MDILTDAEKQTLNDAMAIILAHTVKDATWMFGASCRVGYVPYDEGVTYFDSERTQYSRVTGDTFADRIEAALQIEATIEKDAEVIRLRKVEKLRAELAALEAS